MRRIEADDFVMAYRGRVESSGFGASLGVTFLSRSGASVMQCGVTGDIGRLFFQVIEGQIALAERRSIIAVAFGGSKLTQGGVLEQDVIAARQWVCAELRRLEFGGVSSHWCPDRADAIQSVVVSPAQREILLVTEFHMSGEGHLVQRFE